MATDPIRIPEQDLASADAAALVGRLHGVAWGARMRPYGLTIAKRLERAAAELELAAGLLALREREEGEQPADTCAPDASPEALPACLSPPTELHDDPIPLATSKRRGRRERAPEVVTVPVRDWTPETPPRLSPAAAEILTPATAPRGRSRAGSPPGQVQPRGSDTMTPAERGAVHVLELRDVLKALRAGGTNVAQRPAAVAERLRRAGLSCSEDQVRRFLRAAATKGVGGIRESGAAEFLLG